MTSAFMCGMEDLLFSGSRFVWNFTITTLRRWYSERVRTCQQMLRTWCGLRDIYQMTEGRHCQVNLLDGRKLELLVQPKLLSRELLDLVASHFNLKEKEYFGITFINDTGQNNWLQLDRRVLDHDLPKKAGPVTLFFSVKFYIESISFLKDITTVELFFLNTKSAIYKHLSTLSRCLKAIDRIIARGEVIDIFPGEGDIEVSSETVFELAAHILQEAKGDYSSDESARVDLKKLPALPTQTLQEHPSLAYCEDRVIDHYKKLKGLTRGQAIVNYMTIVEALPTYGVHYYGVKDKQGIPWWLGIGCKGIGQYDFHDKVKPRKIFQWKQLENLYFRDKKFAVEVHDPRRVPLSRRTFGQSALVVNTWYASTSQIKSIWVMAISQHQFYLDRKQSKAKIPSARSISDIAMDLTDTGTSKASKLATVDGKNLLITTSNGSLISSGSQDSEVSDEQKKEKLIELKQRQSTLQEILDQKMEELKKICLREAELTGTLPKEYPQKTGEARPHVRRRVGTAFKLDDNLLQTEEDPYLQDVENKFVIQQKIVEAAKKLANDPDLCKNLKKKRKLDYIDALKKLQEIENASNEYRIKCGRKPTQRTSLIVSDEGIPSECSSLSDTNTMDDDDLHIGQRQRSFSNQQTLRPLPPQSLEIKHSRQRRSSTSEQFHDKGHLRQARYITNEAYYVQDGTLRSHRELSSTHSSPYRTQVRQSHGGRSMPATPVLTRNAYSSSHLRPELSPKHFRQRSGSLESQSNQQDEPVNETTVFSLTQAQRSNSTELLDDGSSYTSQSSAEYYSSTSKPHQYYSTMTVGCRSRERRRHKKPNTSSATSGSMPNLAPKEGRNGVYQNSHNQPSSDYYIPGYQPYSDFEPCGYTYENDTEGHYNVKAPYRSQHPGAEYYRGYTHFYPDETESRSQNPYATLRNPRRGGAKNEQITKNIQKALVAESLRGWYERASTHRDPGLQAGLDSYRGSQQSLGFTYMQGPFSTTSRATSFSSVSSAISTGTWRSQHTMGLQEYDPIPYTSSFNNTYSNTAQYNRPYPEKSYLDNADGGSQLEEDPYDDDGDDDDDEEDEDDEQVLMWHADAKPGTLV